jgi:hypothetical protein
MKFSEFLQRQINESEPIIFKGPGGDPYQYKIEGDKVYYSKKSQGTLDATSDKWIEQTSVRGIDAIKDLYSKVSPSAKNLTKDLTKNLTIDEGAKEKIIKLQEILNKAKPAIPKLWTLPLKVDGIPGWRTAWSWHMIMVIFPQMDKNDLKDIRFYSKQAFDGFKNPANFIDSDGNSMEINNALDYFEKYILDPRWTKEGKIDFDIVLASTENVVNFMIGELAAGSRVHFLYCNSTTKSIPESITAETVIVEADCPLKSLPSSTTCKSLWVSSDNASNQFEIPLIKTNAIEIFGPVTISPRWEQIDYLIINDNLRSEPGVPANKNPIPKTLKNIGGLVIRSQSITNLPDDLKIGEIFENYSLDPIKPDPILNNIPIGDEQDKLIKMRKKPWLKRLFSKTKYEYYTESNSYSIYEGFSGDPGNLDIQGCLNIRTLPKGLVVLGDFYIQGSFIEGFEDEQIRAVCEIKGNIIRTPEVEDVLEP